MSVINDVRQLLADTLQLGERAQHLEASTPLLGSLPELDSMAVAEVVAGIEQRFRITVHDDEISVMTFETLGSLAEFVEHKLRS